jgi:hypothetical protein
MESRIRGRSTRSKRDITRALSEPAHQILCNQSRRELNRRSIARRSHVTYDEVQQHFSSTEVLLAEICLDKLCSAPLEFDIRQTPGQRVRSQCLQLVGLMADQPSLAVACAAALLSDDAATREVRADIDAELGRRVDAALGSGAWPEVGDVIRMALLGGFVRAACGADTLNGVAESLCTLVDTLLSTDQSDIP